MPDLLDMIDEMEEESEKVPDEKILPSIIKKTKVPGEIISGKIAIATPSEDKIPRSDPEVWEVKKVSKSINDSKNHIGDSGLSTGEIDKKINEKFNKIIDNKIMEFERNLSKRALELISIGVDFKDHVLTRENVIEYFKIVPKSKPYELRRFFSKAMLWEITKIIRSLYSEKILLMDRNKFYYLDRKKIN